MTEMNYTNYQNSGTSYANTTANAGSQRKYYSDASIDNNVIVHVMRAFKRDGSPIVTPLPDTTSGKRRARISAAIVNQPRIAREIERANGLAEGTIQPEGTDRFFITYTVWERDADYLLQRLTNQNASLVLFGVPTVSQRQDGNGYFVNVSCHRVFVVHGGGATQGNAVQNAVNTAPVAATAPVATPAPAPEAAPPVSSVSMPEDNSGDDFPWY